MRLPIFLFLALLTWNCQNNTSTDDSVSNRIPSEDTKGLIDITLNGERYRGEIKLPRNIGNFQFVETSDSTYDYHINFSGEVSSEGKTARLIFNTKFTNYTPTVTNQYVFTTKENSVGAFQFSVMIPDESVQSFIGTQVTVEVFEVNLPSKDHVGNITFEFKGEAVDMLSGDSTPIIGGIKVQN